MKAGYRARFVGFLVITVGTLLTACATASAPATPQSPLLIHTLDVVAEPREAADFLVNPNPLGDGGYTPGVVVTIDALPKPGWELREWVGPVHGASGNTAKLQMHTSQTVVVRFARIPPPLPAATVIPTPAPTPTSMPLPISKPTKITEPTIHPTPTRTLVPTAAPTPAPLPTATPTPTPVPPQQWRLEDTLVAGNVVTVVITMEGTGSIAATLDGVPTEEVITDPPLRAYVFRDISQGRHEVRVWTVDVPRQQQVRAVEVFGPKALPTPTASPATFTPFPTTPYIYPSPTPRPQVSCCKICRKGKACGNSCISRSYNCNKGRGCACNASVPKLPGEVYMTAMQGGTATPVVGWSTEADIVSTNLPSTDLQQDSACSADLADWAFIGEPNLEQVDWLEKKPSQWNLMLFSGSITRQPEGVVLLRESKSKRN